MTTPKKKRVLMVSPWAKSTGFGRVAAQIKQAIKDDFEIHHIAIGYDGDPYQEAPGQYIYSLKAKGADHMGVKRIARLMAALQPSMFFLVTEITFARFYLESLRYRTKPLKTVCYLAIDGLIGKPRKMIATLKGVDLCVFYTQFAHGHVQALMEAQPSLRPAGTQFATIPHGVETDHFYPLPSKNGHGEARRAKAKARMFPNIDRPEEAFVIFNGNRATPRKRIDITLKAFADFAQDKAPSVYLCLHHAHAESLAASHLKRLIDALGLSERVILTAPKAGLPMLDNETLNTLYNACDVGVNTCMAEGWGLVNCEHGATGAPQVLPYHTAFPEIWGDAAQWVVPHGTTTARHTPHQCFTIETAAVTHALETLYQNRAMYQQKSKAVLASMQNPKFQWGNIRQTWQATLKNVV